MPKAIQVRLMQTSDSFIYYDILKLTAEANILYCKIQNIDYESYVGIKRGTVPWQATYNRIFMLNELLENGFDSWVFYLDADAFVVDLRFDIRQYLATVGDYCFIGQGGGSADTPWDINAGVFFLNLGDPDGRAMVRDWLARFTAMVPEHFLQSPTAEWDDYPNDQAIMYECLMGNPKLLSKTKRETRPFLNYTDGTFVRQAIRAGFPKWNDRVAWVASETRHIAEKFAAANEASAIRTSLGTYPISFELTFRAGGNGAAFTRSGFSVPEPMGTWMIDGKSTLEIPSPVNLDRSGPGVAVEIVITPALRAGSFDSQPIEIRANSTPIARLDVVGQTDVTFDIAPELIDEGRPIEIEILHEGFIPGAKDSSGDRRNLAAWLWSLNARAVAKLPPRTTGLHPISVFQIRPRGFMANQMIQYMIGLTVQAQVPGCKVVGVELNEWGINTLAGVTDWAEMLTQQVHELDVPEIVRRLRSEAGLRVSYDQCGQRLENFLPASFYRGVFPAAQGGDVQWFDERFLVIHIRGGEILSGDWPDYTLLPIAFYQDVIEKTGLIPVFVGQLQSNAYVDALRQMFPHAPFLSGKSALYDFQSIRRSKNILIAVSTYSWLAAWLSTADRIIMPITGFYNPEQDPRVDLLPADDTRYQFYKFPVNKAVHVSQVLEHHRALDGSWRDLSAEETQELRDRFKA